MPEFSLPYQWAPREYQKPLWNYFMSPGTGKRASIFWHRRAGKDLFAMNLISVMAHKRVGAYWHIFPQNKQGKRIAWNGRTGGIIDPVTHEVKEQGRPFLSYLGGPRDPKTKKPVLQEKYNDQEMTYVFKNGSMYQVLGADSDSLVGGNPVGIVFSEWALIPKKTWEYLSPILAENGGWALFITTPRGKNHAYDMHEMAKDNDNWFRETLIAGDQGTRDEAGNPVVPDSFIEQAKMDGMEEERIRSDFYCDTEAPVSGAYYGRQMMEASDQGRVTDVPWMPQLPVYTSWDLGANDATAIWFFQRAQGAIHVIDYIEERDQPLNYYIKLVRERPYTYEAHYAPHDIEKREITSAEARIVTAAKMGIRFTPIPFLSVRERIDAARNLIPVCRFDATKCGPGIEALRSYTKKWNDKDDTYMNVPKHDWASNGADAFGYFALAAGPEPDTRNKTNYKGSPIMDSFDYLA